LLGGALQVQLLGERMFCRYQRCPLAIPALTILKRLWALMRAQYR
jgi:hypothetical protein